MDLNIATVEIIKSIMEYDYYDALLSTALSERVGKHDKLNKMRQKSAAHIGTTFEGIKFTDSKGQLLAPAKLIDLFRPKIENMPKKELKDFADTLKNDAKKVFKLYREVVK